MSGGHFEYLQYHIEDIAFSIEQLIETNTKDNEWGEHRGYSAQTLEKFKLAIETLRSAEIMAHRVDWLVSGDDDEESFHRRWAEAV